MNDSEKIRNDAYKAIVGKLPMRRRVVYNLIKDYGVLSGEQVAEKMVLRLNEVSGRITELNQLRLIKYHGTTQNTRSKNANSLWGITSPEEREEYVKIDLITFKGQIADLELDLINVRTDQAIAIIKKEITRIEKRIKLIS